MADELDALLAAFEEDSVPGDEPATPSHAVLLTPYDVVEQIILPQLEKMTRKMVRSGHYAVSDPNAQPLLAPNATLTFRPKNSQPATLTFVTAKEKEGFIVEAQVRLASGQTVASSSGLSIVAMKDVTSMWVYDRVLEFVYEVLCGAPPSK